MSFFLSLTARRSSRCVRPVSLAIRFSTLLRMLLPLDVDIARRHPLAAPAGSSLAEAVVAAAAASPASLAATSPTLNQHARTPSEIERKRNRCYLPEGIGQGRAPATERRRGCSEEVPEGPHDPAPATVLKGGFMEEAAQRGR
jgi:hypothetical protein